MKTTETLKRKFLCMQIAKKTSTTLLIRGNLNNFVINKLNRIFFTYCIVMNIF